MTNIFATFNPQKEFECPFTGSNVCIVLITVHELNSLIQSKPGYNDIRIFCLLTPHESLFHKEISIVGGEFLQQEDLIYLNFKP